MREFNDILEEAFGQQTRLLTDAYEAGRVAGRQEAAAEFRRKLAGLLADDVEANEQPQASPLDALADDAAAGQTSATADAAPEGRAQPGSVKPRIAELVAEHPGISTRELERITGFKLNSIRGTLWTLQKEGVVERRDDGLYPAPQKDEAVGVESVEDAPTASVKDDLADILGPQTPDRGPQAAERQVVHEKID